jgi:hypothetical protein
MLVCRDIASSILPRISRCYAIQIIRPTPGLPVPQKKTGSNKKKMRDMYVVPRLEECLGAGKFTVDGCHDGRVF